VVGWEDSDFQPNDYQSLALSSRHRWPAPAWRGRRSPHRLAGGMVPTAPDARPSAQESRAHSNRVSGYWPLCEETEFLRQRRTAETFSLKFNWPFAEKRAHTRQPRSFGHFASHEIPQAGRWSMLRASA
jgi:hypothetical protein